MDPVEAIHTAVPTTAIERRKVFDDAAIRFPDEVRRWIQSHPKNLQAYMGWDVEPFHEGAFEDALQYRETFWLAPRGSGKSTSLGVFFPTWLAISPREAWAKELQIQAEKFWKDAPREIGPHNIRVAMTTNSADRAVGMLWQAKAILSDNRLSQVFGKQLSGKRWKDSGADSIFRSETLREATFSALGLGSTQAGGHFDVLVADDWVTEDNARTELQRQRLSDFWKFTVRGTMEPWCHAIGCGTRYHPLDWYGEVRDWVSRGLWANIRQTRALTEHRGELVSYWPRVYPVAKLQEIREQIGPIAFATQYQNEVSLLLGSFFQREWLERLRKWEEFPGVDRGKARTVATCDPSIKAGPRNDYTAFVVQSIVPPYLHVRRCHRGQWTLQETIQQALNLWDQFKFDTLGVEVVQGQEWLVQELKKRARFQVRPLNPVQFKGKDKAGRANYTRVFFERGQISFEEPTQQNGVGRLLEELMAFAPGSSGAGIDDCADAFVWGVILSTMSRTRFIKTQGRRF